MQISTLSKFSEPNRSAGLNFMNFDSLRKITMLKIYYYWVCESVLNTLRTVRLHVNKDRLRKGEILFDWTGAIIAPFT